jgi:hypothetical protein
MKKTFLFTLITATFLLFSSAGCKKEGFEIPVTNKPNLTIENVAGPDIEECGGFKWDVKFNLNEASKAGGWIIQKITYKRNVINCPNVPFLNDDITYWEAWRVAAGAKGDSDRLAGAFNYDDRYSSPNFPNTKGNTTVTGEVRFFEGINLPAGFVKNNNKTYAGGLPATTDKEPHANPSRPQQHRCSSSHLTCPAYHPRAHPATQPDATRGRRMLDRLCPCCSLCPCPARNRPPMPSAKSSSSGPAQAIPA